MVTTDQGPQGVSMTINTAGALIAFSVTCEQSSMSLALEPGGSWAFSGSDETWNCPAGAEDPAAEPYRVLFNILRDSNRWALTGSLDNPTLQVWSDGGTRINLTPSG